MQTPVFTRLMIFPSAEQRAGDLLSATCSKKDEAGSFTDFAKVLGVALFTRVNSLSSLAFSIGSSTTSRTSALSSLMLPESSRGEG